ncbi:hypothetical protein RO575_08335 [Methylomonas sp. MO1]|uniref:hypothetical protein n=1 Tax=Methylomonas sp. MO1 TaxID=3073619 RepID=UPI0028A30707|nr:hypothetical protein [Methylomonas sp. MO1]MDT4289564.1 hypothetical protein [Methylomonas sp. MO1]
MNAKSASINYTATSSSAGSNAYEYVFYTYKQDNVVNTKSSFPTNKTIYAMTSGKVVNKKSIIRDEFRKINMTLKGAV